MWHELAVTIVAALVASAAEVTKVAVKDAYSGLKSILSDFLPRFSVDEVTAVTAKEKADELELRLSGLTDAEREAVSAAGARLVGEVSRSAFREALQGAFGDEFIVKDVVAETGDVEIRVVATGRGRDIVEEVKAAGNIKIIKEIEKS